jgi:hypothetical protein
VISDNCGEEEFRNKDEFRSKNGEFRNKDEFRS